MNTPRLYWNVDDAVAVVLFISAPRTQRVLVPKDDGFGISDPLFAQVDDDHVDPLFHEYSQDIAVPQDMYGFQYERVDDDNGARMFILSSGFKAEDV